MASAFWRCMGVWVCALIAMLIQRLFSLRNLQKKSAPKCVCQRCARGGRQTGGLSAASACGRRQHPAEVKGPARPSLSHTTLPLVRPPPLRARHSCTCLYAPALLRTTRLHHSGQHSRKHTRSSLCPQFFFIAGITGAGFPLVLSTHCLAGYRPPRSRPPCIHCCSVRMVRTHPPLFRTLAVPGHPLHT